MSQTNKYMRLKDVRCQLDSVTAPKLPSMAKLQEVAALAVILFPGCPSIAVPGAPVQGYMAAMVGADF